MKYLLPLFTFLIVPQALSFSEELRDEWEHFKEQHTKRYSNQNEEEYRLQTYFLKNKMMITEHNKRHSKGEVTFKLKMNKFGDMSHHEFMAAVRLENRTHRYSGGKGQQHRSTFNEDIEEEIDWRERGAVTPVKNQRDCGSCWSFVATGAIESHHFIRTGQLVSLSEQNLIDCSRDYGLDGCLGGWMDDAFLYVQENGIDTEESYPYENKEGLCRYKANYSVASVTGVVDIQHGNEKQLQDAVGNFGPVAVAIDGSPESFRFYSEGVFYDPSCSFNTANHAGLVVGYGSDNGHDYWLVKNSWGTEWGMEGYFKIARNKQNHCGVASFASYPIVQ